MIDIRLPNLYPKQRAAFFGPERVSVTEGSTKSGKSMGILAWLIYQAINNKPGSSRIYVAPVYDLSLKMWNRVCRQFVRAKVPAHAWSANKSELTITVPGGSKIFFRSGDEPNRIYGADYADAAIDEGSRCKEEVWSAVVSTTTATQGKIRVIGNVYGRGNWFYRLCRKAEGVAPNMTYHRLIAADAVAAGVLKQEVIDEQRSMLPDHIFKELYECIPAEDGTNPFGYSHIQACIKELSTLDPIVYGVDLAKTTDYTVAIGMDRNGDVCKFIRWNTTPWPDTTDRVQMLIGKTPTLIDATGVGSPVYDDLYRRGCNVTPYKFTPQTKQACLSSLIRAVQFHEVGFPKGEIPREMETFEYRTSIHGNVQYTAPDGLHDDCVIALALAYCHLPTAGVISVTDYVTMTHREPDNWESSSVGGGQYRAVL
jgi:phage FluMu gp28-like protein